MANDRHDETVEGLLPAYALGALDLDDQRRVEAHLDAHPEARDELEALRETLGLLALAAPPLAPPPGAKAALLARVGALAGPGGSSGTPGGEADGRAPIPFRPPSGRAPAGSAAAPQPAPRPATGPVRFDRRWRAALAAVAAAVVLALTGWNVALQRQIGATQGDLDTLRGQIGAQADAAALGRLVGDQRFARPLRASAAGDGTYSASGGPAGYAYLDPQGNLGLLNCYWMPVLAPNQVYQVWLVRKDGGRDNGGTFTVDARGNASVVVHAPAPFGSYASIGVTAEPGPNGSPTAPTTPRVVWADLN